EPQPAAQRQTTERPLILREDAEVLIEVVLPPGERRLYDDLERLVVARHVPDAARGLVVVAPPKVPALQLEADFGVVRSGDGARGDVERLGRQPIVEIETGRRPIGQRWRNRSAQFLNRDAADASEIRCDRVRA